MEASPHYSTNGINTSAAAYPSPSALSPQHLQQPSAAVSSKTLPPLQPNHQLMQQHSPYGSYPHTPRTATPNTPSSSSTNMSYPPPPPQNGSRGAGYSVMGSNPYPQPYPATTAVMSATTTAAAHPQPIAPAPSPGLGRNPPVLRPMPTSGVIPQPGMNSPYGQSPLMPQQSMLSEGDQPTHVVGSQGRRGILPSAPGRPAAPAAGTSGKTQIPQKDADGKFPCPHCTKTYLHAKHLKRHLLRHTGDRPYMCVLCRDTFSRSDILKRHFIKCSVRRGNPTGATHLSHPQAHVKKNSAGQKLPTDGSDVNHINGMTNMPTDGMVHPFGLIPAPDGLSNVANDQSQLSRSSSIQRLDDANRDRRSMTGSVMGATTRGGSFDQQYNGGEVANNIGNNINPQLGSYNMPANQNGIQLFGGSGSTDWSQMFQQGGYPPTQVNNIHPLILEQSRNGASSDPNRGAARAVGIPGDLPSSSMTFPSWGLSPAMSDSCQQLSSKIIEFLQSRDSRVPTPGILPVLFHTSKIRDLLDNYTHFHTHFPILHIPTLRVTDVYPGLLASMCCIGACYTGGIPAEHIREVVDYFHDALRNSSRVFAAISQGEQLDSQPFGCEKSDTEELQAVMLVQVLMTWHGTQLQREKARAIFPRIASFVRQAGLFYVSKSTILFSAVHQPDFSTERFDSAAFDWRSWVEQEKRVRIMYFIYLSDVALGLYFNCDPQFDSLEIYLPLPTDEAAWEAKDSVEAAEALGLRGYERARMRNPDGTQRPAQLQIRQVLKTLLDEAHNIRPNATNLYGKFILIHALLAMMKRAQLGDISSLSRRSPIPQNPWLVGPVGDQKSSDPGLPIKTFKREPGSLDPQAIEVFTRALAKFKQNWDCDMAIQFPPSMEIRPRRYGFSRDGIHFYWVARFLLGRSLPSPSVSPDLWFRQMMHILKSFKAWVSSDGAARGEEPGSVGEIDASYADFKTDLTLDITQLFRPLSDLVKAPGIAAV
ncbi:fungal-specific transcription factor domain-containing protein [Echria macrotheca]|uniref:Fungal-specific transcription factor domain-containing protein n=1 Tax=Echria macrotheca TaxID=438768 RepID=A0AAJ0BCH9_9PEZI|nr:fungal-specific transcription factor domain-containing protein [Echria macrotheca]